MAFFDNVGVTPPTKDNIYSLFNILNANDHKFGRIRKQKTSTGLRIFIDNEICYNIKGITYISESNDYDTEEIVKFLIESHLCIEDIQSISLSIIVEVYHKKIPYKYRLNGELLSRIYGPKDVLAEIMLKNNSLIRITMRPIGE